MGRLFLNTGLLRASHDKAVVNAVRPLRRQKHILVLGANIALTWLTKLWLTWPQALAVDMTAWDGEDGH